MNSWCFREIQRQIEYKAAWEGIRVVYVRAANTSKSCSNWSINKNLTCGRAWTCPTCDARHDRDLNAALNIMSRYLEAAAVRPSDEGPPREAMVLRDAVGRWRQPPGQKIRGEPDVSPDFPRPMRFTGRRLRSPNSPCVPNQVQVSQSRCGRSRIAGATCWFLK
jgi:hypothetical protein